MSSFKKLAQDGIDCFGIFVGLSMAVPFLLFSLSVSLYDAHINIQFLEFLHDNARELQDHVEYVMSFGVVGAMVAYATLLVWLRRRGTFIFITPWIITAIIETISAVIVIFDLHFGRGTFTVAHTIFWPTQLVVFAVVVGGYVSYVLRLRRKTNG